MGDQPFDLTALSIFRIAPGLHFGNLRSTYPVHDTLRQNDIKSVLSVNDTAQALWENEGFTRLIKPDRHLRIFCFDSRKQDLLIHMRRACDFIEESLSHGHVLAHCVLGISRSAAIVITYLMRLDRASLAHVLAAVKAKRQRVKPSTNFITRYDI